jgi:hypothetical protein
MAPWQALALMTIALSWGGTPSSGCTGYRVDTVAIHWTLQALPFPLRPPASHLEAASDLQGIPTVAIPWRNAIVSPWLTIGAGCPGRISGWDNGCRPV